MSTQNKAQKRGLESVENNDPETILDPPRKKQKSDSFAQALSNIITIHQETANVNISLKQQLDEIKQKCNDLTTERDRYMFNANIMQVLLTETVQELDNANRANHKYQQQINQNIADIKTLTNITNHWIKIAKQQEKEINNFSTNNLKRVKFFTGIQKENVRLKKKVKNSQEHIPDKQREYKTERAFYDELAQLYPTVRLQQINKETCALKDDRNKSIDNERNTNIFVVNGCEKQINHQETLDQKDRIFNVLD